MATITNQWKCNSSGVDNIGGNTGTLTGSYATITPKEGSACLDYSALLTAGSLNSLIGSATAQFSVSFWVRTDQSSYFSTDSLINNPSNRFFISMGSRNAIGIVLATSAPVNNSWLFPISPSMTLNAWHSMIFTYDYSLTGLARVKFYYDGVAVSYDGGSSSFTSLSAIDASGDFILGSLASWSQRDDFRVYSGVLTPSEAYDIFNPPPPSITSITSNVVSYSGTTITITGIALLGTATTVVTIDGTDFSRYVLTSSATTITMVSPNLSNGAYSVVVVVDGVSTNSSTLTYTSGRSTSMSTYAFDVLLTNSAGVASTGLTITAVNILGGVGPYSLTEKGNGWYSHTAMPQGEYIIYKDVSGTPTSTGVYVSHTPGISEEVGGYKNVLDQKLKKEYKSVYNFGPQGTYFNAASVIACIAQGVSDSVKKIVIPPGIYLLESVVTLANDDITLLGYGNVTFKYPTGITTANWSLLKLGGANIKVKGIAFDCAGMDNTNTTLGAIHTYQAGAVNCSLEDCLIKTRVGGPAVHAEYGSVLKIDSCKFSGNTIDIKSRVANFNNLHMINNEFTAGSQVIDTDSGLVITSVGGKSLGSIIPQLTFTTQYRGCYHDGTNVRKIPGATIAWMITPGGTMDVYYKDITALSSHEIFTFSTVAMTINGSGRIDANSFYPTYGITYDGGTSYYRTKTFQIGDWNMDSTGSVTIDVSSIKGTASKYHAVVKSINVMIISDAESSVTDFMYLGQNAFYITEATGLLTLVRAGAGYFDDPAWDSTSFNRGYVTITYLYT